MGGAGCVGGCGWGTVVLYLPCCSTRYPSDSKTSQSQFAVARFCTGSAPKCRGTEMRSTHSRSCASVMVSSRALILDEGLAGLNLREWTSFIIQRRQLMDIGSRRSE